MANIIDTNNANRQTDVNNANELTDINNIMNRRTDVNNINGRISTCIEIKMEPSVDEKKKWERDGVIYQEWLGGRLEDDIYMQTKISASSKVRTRAVILICAMIFAIFVFLIMYLGLSSVLMGLCANVTVLGPGMGFGYSAVAEPAMRAPKTDDLQLDADQANWMATVSALGTPIGCLVSSLVMRRGRKVSMFATSLISLAGWLTIYTSNSYEQILVGRAISGIATGMASVPTTVYVAEIASSKLRSTMVTWTSVFTAFAVFIVYIFGYIFKDDWRLVALMCALFPVMAIALIVLVIPESSLWLRDQNRPEEALEVMKKFRGIPKDQPAPAELLFELKPRLQKKNQNLLQHLVKRSSLVPFVIMLSYFFFQQFSGIFIVIYNAVAIMDKSGIQIDPYIGAVLIGVSRFTVSLVTAGISRKFGRRIPSMISGVGMTIFMGILSLYLFLAENGTVMPDNGVIPVVCLMLYIFMSTLGYLIIPFAMVGEIFPPKVKDILSNLTVAIGYVFSAITVKTYPDMLRLMSMQGVFIFFAIISFVGVIFILLFLPETKGKTLREIEDMFSKKKVFELPTEGVVEERVASNAVGLLRN